MIKKLIDKIKGIGKYFTIVFGLLIIIILSGLVTPILISYEKNHWETDLTNRTAHIESSIKKLFGHKEVKLLETKTWLKHNLSRTLKSESYHYKELIELVNDPQKSNYSLEIINPNGKLIAWNENIAIPQEDIFPLAYPIGETYFHTNGLLTYLTVMDTVYVQNDVFYLITSEEIEKNYHIQNEFYKEKSFTNEIANKFLTTCFVDYNPFTEPPKDGRIYTTNLINYKGTKIGQVNFYKPSLNVSISGIREITSKIQSTLVVLVLVFLGLGFRKEFRKIDSKIIRFGILVLYLSLFRALIFLVEFPSMFLTGPLVNPANFSSVLAWGLVKSPMEFFVTNLFLVIIGIQLFRYTFQYVKSGYSKKWWVLKILSVPFLLLLFFLLLRGLSASIKSVIFDSAIRYFKEPTPIPSSDILFMNLNVLILGLSIVLVMLSFILIISSYLRLLDSNYKLLRLTILFLSVQVIGYYLIDYIKEPLITHFLAYIFITLLFGLVYVIFYRSNSISQSLVYSTIIASVISVVLMNFFNLELEKQSLKRVAFEIIRANENLLNYMCDETLRGALKDEELAASFSRSNVNYDAQAFRVWSQSPLQRESISSGIFLYDMEQREIGSFSVGLEKEYNVISYFDTIQIGESVVKKIPDSTGNKSVAYIGIIPVIKREIVIGFIAVEIDFNINNFESKNIPDFLKSNSALLGSVINPSQLKIFEFDNSELTQVYGDIYPSREQMIPIYNARLSKFNDAWTTFSIYGENYIAYINKMEFNGDERLITVAVKEKEISWNLFNFFKMFLIHSIFIIVIFLFLLITKLLRVQSSFRTKLLFTFLLVSIVPLAILAIYNREVVAERSEQFIYDELSKRTDYLEKNVDAQLSNHKDRGLAEAFSNAGNELAISFAVYQNTDQVFSSKEEIYRTGLFHYKLNSHAHYNLNYLSYREFFSHEYIDNYKYDAYYRKITINGVPLIIGVNDAFNKIEPAFSTADIDVILFGVYAFVMILIIIVSTLLANQISAPIRRLTKATEAVAHGDLNVELHGPKKGEVSELYDGFNLMTKELQKNQIDLAELEREAAWKEMAKQVAHEIKNPLTPIKLAIQQLIASHKEKSKDFDKIFNKVTKTTLNQIDNLSQIASEFSSFAKMPSLKLEVMNLIPVIKDTINLFTDDKIDIKFNNLTSNPMVEADPSQLRRMIINLIRNSIQAKANQIKITLSKKNENYSLVTVDNGEGIKESNKSKIFDSNFTTKDKGMGLGLKLTKRFLESINGSITLLESTSEGTSFEILIPKHNTEKTV